MLRAFDLLRERKVVELVRRGVMVLDPRATWIGPDVEIGRERSSIPPSFSKAGRSIGRDCVIHPGAHLIDSRLGHRVKVFAATVMERAEVERDVTVGPFARLRPERSSAPARMWEISSK